MKREKKIGFFLFFVFFNNSDWDFEKLNFSFSFLFKIFFKCD